MNTFRCSFELVPLCGTTSCGLSAALVLAGSGGAGPGLNEGAGAMAAPSCSPTREQVWTRGSGGAGPGLNEGAGTKAAPSCSLSLRG